MGEEAEKSQQEKVGQEQIHDLLFGERLSWQAIIYDLINTEQLDPWDINISLLAEKYLERVQQLEEANFFVSSKVLFAASLLVRMKSEILLNHDIPGLDEILFGKKEEKQYSQERIELDDELPDLVPRTPLPRFKKVTLQELMTALGKAIKTENRRIKKEIVLRQRAREAEVVLPKNVINIRERIKDVYGRLRNVFSDRKERLAFSELLKMHHGEDEIATQDKIAAFVSLLHLDNQQKVWLQQENHFEEIWILLKKLYEEQNKEKLTKIRSEIDALQESHEQQSKQQVDTGFDHSEIEGALEEE